MKTTRKPRKAKTGPEMAPAPQRAQAKPSAGPEGASLEAAPAAVRLSGRARWLISAALLFHLGAVAVAALRVPPVSPLGESAAEAVRWYTDVVLVMPGYRFFAPEPDASQMLRVEMVAADGSQHEEIYPDLARQWPRLLYHRHFMLTSRMQTAPLDPLSQALADSYARHLLAREGAQEVRIFRRQHQLPSRDEVLKGTLLTDAGL